MFYVCHNIGYAEGSYRHNEYSPWPRVAAKGFCWSWSESPFLLVYSTQWPLVTCTCQGYQLVITGHSLGAGVASILALLIKLNLNFPNMTCYAFSPPGSLFSFPLAQYCRQFITAVVLGNDIVPRFTPLLLVQFQHNNYSYLFQNLIAFFTVP